MKYYDKYISKNVVESIHAESLAILETVGIKIENNQALSILKKHGARVEDDVVFINQKMIDAAVASSPESFELYSSKGNLHVGGGSRITMPAASSIYIEDCGKIRKMTNRDTVNVFKLSTTSKEIGYQFINFFPDTRNFTKEQKIFSQESMLLKYSHQSSHICPNIFAADPEEVQSITRKSVDLIKKFEGVDDKYINLMGVNSLSPLCYDASTIDKLIVFCEENQPVWMTPCGMPALTTPASLLSTMALTNAEVVAGLVLAQLIRPGVPVVYGNTSGSTNLKTVQLSIGAPETALMAYASVAMADYYRIPCRTGGCLSDAKDTDYQSGAESMLVMNATLEAGADLILHACGIMGSFNVTSLEKFLLDEESISFSRRMLKGFDCDPQKAFLKEIQKSGPRGNYMSGRTPKSYREEFIMPKYFNKQDPNEWQSAGSVSLKNNVKDAVNERLSSYIPPDITKEQNDLIKDYLPDEFKISI